MKGTRASLVACLGLVSVVVMGCSKKNEVTVGQACTENADCPDDDNVCTTALCNEGTCEYKQGVPDGTPAEGGGKCYQGEQCKGCWDDNLKNCLPGTEFARCGDSGEICENCDDNNACTNDACAQNACAHDPVPLSDGKPQTPHPCAGACWDGVCCGGCYDVASSACRSGTEAIACGLGGNACSTCDDGNPCTHDVCNEKRYCEAKNLVDGTSCPTGACYGGKCCAGCFDTGSSTCKQGLENTACGKAGDTCEVCTPNNPCMQSSCEAGVCSVPVPLDGTACPSGVCVLGECKCGAPGQPCCGGTTCQNALACSQGTCGDCGAANQPCCPPDNSCAAGNACQSGTCKPCGALNQPCCGGAACTGQTVCQTGTCVACGGTNQPCCAGGACASGHNCNSATCVQCGELAQPCCLQGDACTASGSVCANGACAPCGAASEPCCAGSTCATWSTCASNTCSACGRAGQPCCPGPAGCDDNLACDGGSCRGCVAQISVGRDHQCAIRSDGTLWCWGQNSGGQLGTGDTSGKGVPTQITAQGAGAVAQVACGNTRTAVRKADGTVWHLATSSTQVAFGAGLTALQVAAGGDASCARVTDGASVTIRCWADGGASPYTITLPGARTAADLAVGGHHACAVATDGTAWCWGQNESGQLGSGNTSPTSGTPPTPVQVTWLSGTPTVVQIAAGNAFTCAVTLDQKAWCWGNGTEYQLGNGSNQAINPYPIQVSSLGTAVASLATGRAHVCVRKTGGELWCWGANGQGQSGPGAASPLQAPTQVDFFATGVVAASAGDIRSCSIRSDGTAWCHGQAPTQVAISCP